MPYDGFSIVGRPSYGNSLFYVVGSIRQDHFCVYAVRPGNGKLQEKKSSGPIPKACLMCRLRSWSTKKFTSYTTAEWPPASMP